MLYFAYGSNLNHYQMQKMRCLGSKYLKNIFLKDYQLSFCHPKKNNVFGYANVYKKKGTKVPGAIWKINKKHEEILDGYEQFPEAYRKDYFYSEDKSSPFHYSNILHIEWDKNDKSDVFLHPFDSDNTVDGFIGNSTLDFLDSYDFKKPLHV